MERRAAGDRRRRAPAGRSPPAAPRRHWPTAGSWPASNNFWPASTDCLTATSTGRRGAKSMSSSGGSSPTGTWRRPRLQAADGPGKPRATAEIMVENPRHLFAAAPSVHALCHGRAVAAASRRVPGPPVAYYAGRRVGGGADCRRLAATGTARPPTTRRSGASSSSATSSAQFAMPAPRKSTPAGASVPSLARDPKSVGSTIRCRCSACFGRLQASAVFEFHKSVAEPPAGSLPLTAGGVEIYLSLADVVDVRSEGERVARQTARATEQQIARLQALLGGPFAGRAPTEIVEVERQKLRQAEEEAARLGGRSSISFDGDRAGLRLRIRPDDGRCEADGILPRPEERCRAGPNVLRLISIGLLVGALALLIIELIAYSRNRSRCREGLHGGRRRRRRPSIRPRRSNGCCRSTARRSKSSTAIRSFSFAGSGRLPPRHRGSDGGGRTGAHRHGFLGRVLGLPVEPAERPGAGPGQGGVLAGQLETVLRGHRCPL